MYCELSLEFKGVPTLRPWAEEMPVQYLLLCFEKHCIIFHPNHILENCSALRCAGDSVPPEVHPGGGREQGVRPRLRVHHPRPGELASILDEVEIVLVQLFLSVTSGRGQLLTRDL